MRVEVCATAADAGQCAARLIAEALRGAVLERGLGVAALSGGKTPELMLAALASSELPWANVHLFQVDERIVGDDDDRRNLTSIRRAFACSPLARENLHGMPVDTLPVEAGGAEYARQLAAIAGDPPRIDVVHLGLGDDGHTASLVPGDVTLEAEGDVTISRLYQGTRRMTLTLRALNRAARRVWLVTGESKRDVARRLLEQDSRLVASRVSPEAAVVVLDRAAAGERS
jgi:6-phosphogluconolactonase